MQQNPMMFRPASLRRFMTKALAEINPYLSLSTTALEYYVEIFTSFLMPRACFSYWNVTNDQSSFMRKVPDALKMDLFLE